MKLLVQVLLDQEFRILEGFKQQAVAEFEVVNTFRGELEAEAEKYGIGTMVPPNFKACATLCKKHQHSCQTHVPGSSFLLKSHVLCRHE